jgi:hypothetical protein
MSATGKYEVHNQPIEVILAWLTSGEIAIPEIQRPFVWDTTKVRDLLDSLYQGYPIGYLIAWQNPNVRLKDGKESFGKKVLIDGQQRVTALAASVLGKQIVMADYHRTRIKIAFNPRDQRFEVYNPAIENDVSWLPDVSPLYTGEANVLSILKAYVEANPGVDESQVFTTLQKLLSIKSKQIGIIELAHDLDIDTVTEIFIRINSKGVVLGQADFAMSKIASSEQYGGPVLRKAIDYFCHMAVEPGFHATVKEVDPEFAATEHFTRMSWLRNENDALYDPDYSDLLRVVLISKFGRGKLADLVSLLSGRNFDTRTFETRIAEDAFVTLEAGLRDFMNEDNFKRFLMIVRSAGFIDASFIRSQAALNFSYALYLALRDQKQEAGLIERWVRRWFVMSLITSRYTGSPESAFDEDIRNLKTLGPELLLKNAEAMLMTDSFWEVTIAQGLETSATTSPLWGVFLAAQVKLKDKGFLSRDISIEDLVTHMGDIHHIFPKDFLKKHGLTKGKYNQIANYVYMQSEINIKIGNKAPKAYFELLRKQCEGGPLKLGSIDNLADLRHNLTMNCIPESIMDMDFDDYERFLEERRGLMAKYMKHYYTKKL